MNKSNLFCMILEIIIAVLTIVSIVLGKGTLWTSIIILVCAIISIIFYAISLKDKNDE